MVFSICKAMENYLIPLNEAQLQPSTDTSTRTNEKVHPIMDYLRDLVKTFPKVDNYGRPYKLKPRAANAKGRPKKEDRDYCYETPGSLKRDLPSNPHFISRPSERARAHRPGNGLWTESAMKSAREEFYIPSGLRVVFICFELFDRELMKLSGQHRKLGKEAFEYGIMTKCPHCKSNEHVSCLKYSCDYATVKKTINQELTQDVIVCMQYACKNPTSCRGPSGTGMRTFMAYNKDCWDQVPPLIKRRYMEYVVDLEDTTSNLFLSPGYSDRLLFHTGSFEQFADQMKEANNLRARSATMSYRDFCEEEVYRLPKQCPPGVQETLYEMRKKQPWPAFDEGVIINFFPSPSRPTTTRMWESIFQRAKPNLLRDLLTRLPGRILRVDGTYKIMKMTMNLPDAMGENKVLVVVAGEYGHIVSYAFCDSERDKVIERLFYFLRKWMERLAGPEAVNNVIAVYSDTCCNNSDPNEHWLPLIFPNCKRALRRFRE